MLNRITLSGFRACVETTGLECGRLTVLAGANNVGKSSFVGALLSLVQSQQAASRHRLLLSGEWVDLGPFDELLSPDSTSFSIGIEGMVAGQNLSVLWDFGEEPGRRARAEARVTRIQALHGEDAYDFRLDSESSDSMDQGTAHLLHPGTLLRVGLPDLTLLPFRPEQVLSVGPYRAAPAYLAPFRIGADGSVVGRYGQFAAETYWQHQDEETDIVPPARGEGATERLARAMSAWWSFILDEEIVLSVREEARLGFSVRLDTAAIASRSLSQVGYGISQLWPILVACLVSRKGDLVMIETPEAHLHPGAQHRLTSLLVALASGGRQVIVETHSEHVVAASCLAVKQAKLSDSDLALNFFTQSKGRTSIERIAVSKSGRRLAAPEGFFDQATKDLLALLDAQ